MTLNFYKTVK